MKCPYCHKDHPPGTEVCPETVRELPPEDFLTGKSVFGLETSISGPFFEEGMDCAPETVEEWIGLIDHSIQERNWTESLHQIEEALRVYPNLSYLREKEKEVSEALREISSLRVEIKALKKKDHAIAIEKLTRLLDLVPTDVSVRGQLLEALEQAGRFEEALSLGKTFAKDNPAEFQETKDKLSRLVQAWERGSKEIEARQWAMAKALLEEALTLSPGNKDLRAKLKDVETSLKKIETEEEEKRKKIDDLKEQAEGYLQDGKFEAARRRIKFWLMLSPGDEQAMGMQRLFEQEENKSWVEPFTGMEFVWVQGGIFEMGDLFGGGNADEKPLHTVELDGFWLGKYPVTNTQWEKVMDSNPMRPVSWWKKLMANNQHLSNNPSNFKGPDYPVVNVSWNDAQEFIKKLNNCNPTSNFRLPTEAEWEYAARSGGNRDMYSGGDVLDTVAWYKENFRGWRPNVGGKSPNGIGIYDMSGNVWEWVEDVYVRNAYSQPNRSINPVITSGGSSDRVLRGGSWRDGAHKCRTSQRYYTSPALRFNTVGFRLALSPSQQ